LSSVFDFLQLLTKQEQTGTEKKISESCEMSHSGMLDQSQPVFHIFIDGRHESSALIGQNKKFELFSACFLSVVSSTLALIIVFSQAALV